MPALPPFVAGLRLVDHHCHGVVLRDLARPEFEAFLTEADGPSPLGTTLFDTQVGLALRRWCPPVLDLAPHAEPGEYLRRRLVLGVDEVTRRMLRASGTAAFCVDEGYAPEPLLDPDGLARAAGPTADEVGRSADNRAAGYRVVRLESVAEDVVRAGTTAAGFAGSVRARLTAAEPGAVAWKSVAAYRAGLELSGERPGEREVAAAAGRWLAALDAAGPGARPRLADRTLHEFLIWSGLDLARPVQFHTGYGDADADLRRCDPLLLTDLLRATVPTGVPIMLLHCYPFHRAAGYLAQVFGHVFVDVGLATHNVGRRAPAVLAELLELAPFGKVLYSSDAYGLPELYLLGSVLFRRALADVLGGGVDDGTWTVADARRLADLVASTNARRVYRL